MNAGLVITGDGQLVLVHMETFTAPPIKAEYHIEMKALEITLETGEIIPFPFEADSDTNARISQLICMKTVLVKDKKPVGSGNIPLQTFENKNLIQGVTCPRFDEID